MNENNSNDLQTIITQVIEEMKSEQGDKFDPSKINLAEMGRRTGLTRAQLRRIKANGFLVVPHALTGRKAASTIISGYMGVIDDLLKKNVSNSEVILERIQEQGYTGSLTTVKRYISEHKDLIPPKRQADASTLDIKITTQEIALYLSENKVSPEHLEALKEFMIYLRQNQRDKAISALLQHSRIPQKEPSTFENFDFSRVTGEHAAQIKSLPNLTALYSRQNIAFIGPPGVGKTHLSMAYGNACCHKGLKAYFIKATELNEKFTKARRTGTESSAVSGLVRPSCLIIDEIGRSIFDMENTRLFFDMIDRRCSKEGPNCMIFTSNLTPDKWCDFFREEDSLLCALDRTFDAATVYLMKGESYRGRNLKTYSIEISDPAE